MAIKKNHKKYTNMALLFRLFVLLFLLGAVLSPFAPGLKMSVGSGGGNVVTIYKPAFSFLFGGSISTKHVTYSTIGISVIGLVGYLFSVIALIFLVLSETLFKKSSTKRIVFGMVSLLLVFASSIIMLSIHKSAATVLADAIMGTHNDTVSKTIYNNTSIQFGFYGVSIFGFLATLLQMMSLFFDGTMDKLQESFLAKR